MNKKVRRLSAMVGVVIMLLSFSLAACKPTEDDTEYEEGTAVVFDYNDGVSRPYTVYAEEGESVDEPDTPVREGYKFGYWQTAPDGGEEVEFPYTVTEETVFYAHWEENEYKVTLDYNYEGSTPEVLELKYGSVIQEEDLNVPSREGEEPPMYFYYWQTAPDGGVEVSFPYTVTGDVTFYANWSATQIARVVFDYNYEGAPEGVTIRRAVGSRVTTSDVRNPSRPGYTFRGWSDDPTAERGTNLPYTVRESTTLYAIWEQKSCTVTFVADCLATPVVIYHTKKVLGTEYIQAPESPTREGYTFAGWYTSAGGGTKVEFPLQVLDNARYYAHWTHEPVETKIFDAEFTPFDPNEVFPGYSGSVSGANAIVSDDTNTAHSEPYPVYYDSNGDLITGANYVSFLYKRGLTLTFEIYSDKALDNVSLIASLAVEILDPVKGVTFAPEGDYGYSFIVNGETLNYAPFTVTSENIATTGMAKGYFKEYNIANISLKEGLNVIQLVTNNANKEMGGTLGAVAPMVDYIRLDTSASLSWSPIYDNLVLKG